MQWAQQLGSEDRGLAGKDWERGQFLIADTVGTEETTKKYISARGVAVPWWEALVGAKGYRHKGLDAFTVETGLRKSHSIWNSHI